MKDADVGIVTRASTTTGDDEPRQHVRLASKKKVGFDIATDFFSFFEAKQAIGRNLGKMPIIDMPFAFDASVEAGPSWQHGTFCKFF